MDDFNSRYFIFKAMLYDMANMTQVIADITHNMLYLLFEAFMTTQQNDCNF